MNELWGGYFREESDIVFHLARFSTSEFGVGFVHLDSPIHSIYFSNFPSPSEKKRKREHIDIDITDPDKFCKKDVTHGIFAEVKWIYKDIKKQPYGKARLEIRLSGIEKDLQRLSENLKNKRCENAFMCVVDDEKMISDSKVSEWKQRYPGVNIALFQPICNKRR